MSYKTLQILFIFSIVFTAFLFAQNTNAQIPTPQPGYDSLVSYASNSLEAFSTVHWGDSGGVYPDYVGFHYHVPNNQYICSVSTYLAKENSSSPSNIQAAFYNGVNISAGVWRSFANTISVTDIKTSVTKLNFYFDNCELAIGGDDLYFYMSLTNTPAAENGNGYDFYFQSTGTGTPVFYPDAIIDANRSGNDGAGSWTEQTTQYGAFEVYGFPNFDIETYSPTASDSWFSLSGAETFCDDAFPPATGASASWFNLNITNNLCLGFGFLFIPSGDRIGESYQDVKDQLRQRIPTSYFLQFGELLLNSDNVASASRFEMSLALPLNILGVTSTQSFAPLSSSSVNYYGSSWLPTIRTLMTYILYVGWAFMWYRIGKNKFK